MNKNGNGDKGTSTVPRKTGRPTKYTEEIASRICLLITQGYPLRKIEALDGIPSRQTFFTWLGKYPEFLDRYAQARLIQAEAKAHEIEDLVDDCPPDRDQVQLARLRVDTKKWLMAKLYPTKYGEMSRTQLEVSGQVNHAHKHTLHCNIPTRLSVAEWLEHKKQEQQLLDVTPQGTDAMTDKVSYQSPKEPAPDTPNHSALIAHQRSGEPEDG